MMVQKIQVDDSDIPTVVMLPAYLEKYENA